jgi:DNA-binding MarR family transcriptional regulator
MARRTRPDAPNEKQIVDGLEVAEALRDALRELRIQLAMNARRIAATAGLRDSDLDVLDVLDRRGPQSPTALARRMGIHAATMTGVLTRLENAGWLVRRRDVSDRRSVQIESTGFDRLDRLYREANRQLDAIATGISARDATVIIDYLHQVSVAAQAATTAITEPVKDRRA